MNIEEVRKLFQHLQTDQIYFNHAAIGPWHKLVLDRIQEYSQQRSLTQIENYKSFLKWNDSAKVKLAKLLNTTADRLAWTDNVANGISILAQGIEWETGDRIILNDMEFPSNVYPFLNLKNQGVEVDFVKSRNGIIDIEEIEKLVTLKTKLISISLVQFVSGYRADVTAIGELCKKNGIIFCADAIQGAGVVQIDVNKSKIDFLSGGSQKWLMSSQGLSYIFVTEELQNRIKQRNVGWTSVEDAWNLLDYNLTLKSGADRYQSGTVNAFGVAIFEASLEMFHEFGLKNVESRVLENTSYFIKKLVEIGIEPLLKDVSENNFAGIVSFKHEKANDIFTELEERKIYAAVRGGMIRLSPHFYNTSDEIDSVINCLKEILERIN